MNVLKIDQLIRSHRISISIQVTPEGKLVVKAPRLMPIKLIEKFVQEKSEWIQDRQTKKQQHTNISKKYSEGEVFLYLGKPYKIRFGNFKEISVTDTLQFPNFLLFRVQKELTSWYIMQAKEIISRRVEFHALRMKKTYKSIMFSDTKSKWGTCGPDNSLQFNWKLVMSPLPVIDYVVIHELVHTQQKNHGLDFWREVRLYTPAYKQHRKWLNTNQHFLIT